MVLAFETLVDPTDPKHARLERDLVIGMTRTSGQCCSTAGTEPWHGQREYGHCPVRIPVAIDGVKIGAPMAIEA